MQEPEYLLEAVQIYMARIDVIMNNKMDDWVCIEENIECAKALLPLLLSYKPAASLAPVELQLLAVADTTD